LVVSHEQLWAPWRLSYITAPKEKRTDDATCFLCRCFSEHEDRKNLVVARGKHVLVALNRYPYINGHLLIAPNEHVAELEALQSEVNGECMALMQRLIVVLKQLMTPDGFNAGLNLGSVAGAGVPGHLHWHLVPRWSGDTSFMPVLADVSVIPQSLDALYEALVPALQDG
jgi:ATP adenylyltransferase